MEAERGADGQKRDTEWHRVEKSPEGTWRGMLGRQGRKLALGELGESRELAHSWERLQMVENRPTGEGRSQEVVRGLPIEQSLLCTPMKGNQGMSPEEPNWGQEKSLEHSQDWQRWNSRVHHREQWGQESGGDMSPDRDKPHGPIVDPGWEASQLTGINPCEWTKSLRPIGGPKRKGPE